MNAKQAISGTIIGSVLAGTLVIGSAINTRIEIVKIAEDRENLVKKIIYTQNNKENCSNILFKDKLTKCLTFNEGQRMIKIYNNELKEAKDKNESFTLFNVSSNTIINSLNNRNK